MEAPFAATWKTTLNKFTCDFPCVLFYQEKKNSYYNLGNCQTLGNSKFEFNDFQRVISQISATCKRPIVIQTCSATNVSPGSSLLL